MEKLSKCIYCNKQIKHPYSITAGKDKELVDCCSNECVNRTQTSFRFLDRSRPFFMVGIIISFIFILVSAVFLTISKLWIGSISLRKRYTYGTVMVDLESHRSIDIINSRETKFCSCICNVLHQIRSFASFFN